MRRILSEGQKSIVSKDFVLYSDSNMTDDKQNIADSADEEIADGKSILGHAPEESPDVDDALAAVGLHTDEDEPR